MLDSYVLKGVLDEYLLVIKTEDVKEILAIIDRMNTGRSKWLKDLALSLEQSLYDEGSSVSKPKPKKNSQERGRTTRQYKSKNI
jgi:hypothetical protein